MKNKEFYCNIKISIHKENYSLSKLKTCYEKQQQHLREWIYWQVIFLEKCLYSGYKKSYNPINIWGEDLHINFTKEEISMANEHIERYSMSLTFQFSSVAQSCPTLRDPMNLSTPGLPVHHQLPEFTQTHVHRVSDAIQPSHPLSSPSPPAPNPSQHQSLFQWVNSSHEVAKVLEF